MNYRRRVQTNAWVATTGGLGVQLNVLDNRPDNGPDAPYPELQWTDQASYCLDRPPMMPAGSVHRHWSDAVIQNVVFIG